jgi:hypothetical protein
MLRRRTDYQHQGSKNFDVVKLFCCLSDSLNVWSAGVDRGFRGGRKQPEKGVKDVMNSGFCITDYSPILLSFGCSKNTSTVQVTKQKKTIFSLLKIKKCIEK